MLGISSIKWRQHLGMTIAVDFDIEHQLRQIFPIFSLNNAAKHIGRKIHDICPEACIFLVSFLCYGKSIMETCPYNEYPFIPHFYVVKLWCRGILFSYF